MSVNTLANAAAARRTDIRPVNVVPQGIDQIATASAVSPVGEDVPEAHAVTTSTVSSAGSVDTALNVLFGYIPIEIITLYVAVLGALESELTPGVALWVAFFSFQIATPLVVWIVYAAKLQAARKALPVSPNRWPIWEMSAASIAFLTWAFALPNSPFSVFDSWYSAALAGVVVLVASTVLGLIAPFFQNPLIGDLDVVVDDSHNIGEGTND